MPIQEVENDSVNGMTGLGLTAQKMLFLVQGITKTHMDMMGSKRKMVTTVRCLYDEAPPQDASPSSASTRIYKVVGYCHEQQVADYKFDKSCAVVVATNITLVKEGSENSYEIIAETISIIQKDDVPQVRTTLKTMTSIAMKMLSAPAVPEGTPTPWPESPQCAMKKCNSLTRYPSDESTPAGKSPSKRRRTTSPERKAGA